MSKKIFRTGIYARLSREDADRVESNNIQSQKELLTRHAREQGWTVFGYYVEI